MYKVKFLIAILLISCNNRESKYNYLCGIAPSTPTDLVIINDSSEKVRINLLVKEKKLKRFVSVEVNINEEKRLCIENEGDITDGLYLEYDREITRVILNPSRENKFYIKSRALKVNSIE